MQYILTSDDFENIKALLQAQRDKLMNEYTYNHVVKYSNEEIRDDLNDIVLYQDDVIYKYVKEKFKNSNTYIRYHNPFHHELRNMQHDIINEVLTKIE